MCCQQSINDLKEELKQDHTPEEIEEINGEIAELEARRPLTRKRRTRPKLHI